MITIFKIRILYKSGNSHEAWFREFSFDRNVYNYTPAYPVERPMLLGVDNIEAIFQVEAKEIPE